MWMAYDDSYIDCLLWHAKRSGSSIHEIESALELEFQVHTSRQREMMLADAEYRYVY
jgi:hypothetical protein